MFNDEVEKVAIRRFFSYIAEKQEFIARNGGMVLHTHQLFLNMRQ